MQEITLKIPDTKFNFFLELISQLGDIEVTNNTEIPQWQKDEVLRRTKLSDANPERLLKWEEVKDQFNID